MILVETGKMVVGGVGGVGGGSWRRLAMMQSADCRIELQLHVRRQRAQAIAGVAEGRNQRDDDDTAMTKDMTCNMWFVKIPTHGHI